MIREIHNYWCFNVRKKVTISLRNLFRYIYSGETRDIQTDPHTEGTIVTYGRNRESYFVLKIKVIRANKKDIERVSRGVISKEERRAYLSGQTDLKIGRMKSRIEEVELPGNPGST